MKRKYKILIVDDSEYNRSLLADILGDEYDILEAENGLAAVSCLNKLHTEVQLLLLDIVMPEMDGFEVLTVLNNSGWLSDIPVIMISSETSSAYIDRAYDLGAIEYISRPFDGKTVKRRVKNTIMLYAKQKMLQSMVTEQILDKEKSNLLMVEILSNIVEFRNGESGLHVMHIRVITDLLLRALVRKTDRYQLTPSQIALIVNVSALHDIGKIAIPENILNKPAKLSPEEFEIIKKHCMTGYRILENSRFRDKDEIVTAAKEICRWHHERYDGKGYPDGLKGEEIPIAAQVVSLADVYDALTSVRVYKGAFSPEESLNMIMNGECGAFNPLLLDCLNEIEPILARDLDVSSFGLVSKTEIRYMTEELLQSGDVSNRTLELLEQERTKYQFFASMSKEIQFEYDYSSDLLTLSEYGADLLGLPEILSKPAENERLHTVFSIEDYFDFNKKLNAATLESPIVYSGYYLDVKGEKRWFKVVARPLWIERNNGKYVGIIGKFTDAHEEHEEFNKIIQKSERDSLTGLYNHKSASALVKKIIADCRDQKCAFILLDVDRFKGINDGRGHLFGDKVLSRIGSKLAGVVRAGGIASRVGGDEFMLFFGYVEDINVTVKKIFESLREKLDSVSVTVSIGVSMFPENGKNYEQLFHRADQALYWAKEHGRDRYDFYNPDMHDMLSASAVGEDKKEY